MTESICHFFILRGLGCSVQLCSRCCASERWMDFSSLATFSPDKAPRGGIATQKLHVFEVTDTLLQSCWALVWFTFHSVSSSEPRLWPESPVSERCCGICGAWLAKDPLSGACTRMCCCPIWICVAILSVLETDPLETHTPDYYYVGTCFRMRSVCGWTLRQCECCTRT